MNESDDGDEDIVSILTFLIAKIVIGKTNKSLKKFVIETLIFMLLFNLLLERVISIYQIL